MSGDLRLDYIIVCFITFAVSPDARVQSDVCRVFAIVYDERAADVAQFDSFSQSVEASHCVGSVLVLVHSPGELQRQRHSSITFYITLSTFCKINCNSLSSQLNSISLVGIVKVVVF